MLRQWCTKQSCHQGKQLPSCVQCSLHHWWCHSLIFSYSSQVKNHLKHVKKGDFLCLNWNFIHQFLFQNAGHGHLDYMSLLTHIFPVVVSHFVLVHLFLTSSNYLSVIAFFSSLSSWLIIHFSAETGKFSLCAIVSWFRLDLCAV